jgi:hypothetical protein
LGSPISFPPKLIFAASTSPMRIRGEIDRVTGRFEATATTSENAVQLLQTFNGEGFHYVLLALILWRDPKATSGPAGAMMALRC